jgi:glycerol-3-phosphate dehydrogenase
VTFSRAANLRRLADEAFDVLVVGGGITGAGVALDAATRGLRVALVERDDFASGTSSKSSKLVHGGLRYLQQKEIGLVYEALAERQVLRRIAPHLVRVLPFLLPVFGKDGLVPKPLARALGSAMWMYDLTGGVRIGKLHQRIDADEAHAHMPTLRRERLAASYVYYDAQADDARLTLTIARTAADHGAAVVNHAAVRAFVKDASGNIRGAVVRADGSDIAVSCASVVNATGVWADDVRALDEGTHPGSIRPAKGIHVSVPWQRLRNDIAVVLPVPKDRRSIFVVPWGDVAYVGTTDTDYDGPLDDPQCTPEDIRYLLDAVNVAIDEPITEGDVLGTWAGLRPLVRDAGSERTADLSRRHAVRTSSSGMVTVTGGKLTTYRRMAADAVDEVMDRLDRKGRSGTKHVRLRGATHGGAHGQDPHLVSRFGSDARAVQRLMDDEPDLAGRVVPELPYRLAEVVHAVREEMACTVDDVLSRRMRARLLGRDASSAAAETVAALMGAELGWTEERRREQVASYRASVQREREAAGLTDTALDALTRPLP